MNTDDRQALIVEYLNDELQADARLDFETNLQTDPQLKEELEIARQLQNHLLDDDLAAFQQEIKEIAASAPKKQAIRRMLPLKVWAAAASILLLLGMAWWWTQKPADPDTLFAQYFVAYQAPITKSPGRLTPDQELEKGAKLLAQNQPEEALTHFSKVAEMENLFINTVLLAKWYKALAFFKMKDLSEAKKELREIVLHADVSVGMEEKARELLEGIEGL